MATTLIINNSDWKLTTFYGGALGRCYELTIPEKGKKIFTEEELLEFFDSLPDRTVRNSR